MSESELYIEPTQMAPRDVVGVVIALIALAIIGVSGYVWLNPKLDAHSLLAFGKPPAPPSVPIPANPVAHISCPYCQMYADTSDGMVSVMWQGGGSATFDSFDCLFNYMKEKRVKLDSATVLDYGSKADHKMIDVKQASYLYDTTVTVEGSMPPNVAAYESPDKAAAAKKSMGGELLDFSALQAKWKE